MFDMYCLISCLYRIYSVTPGLIVKLYSVSLCISVSSESLVTLTDSCVWSLPSCVCGFLELACLWIDCVPKVLCLGIDLVLWSFVVDFAYLFGFLCKTWFCFFGLQLGLLCALLIRLLHIDPNCPLESPLQLHPTLNGTFHFEKLYSN